MHFPRICGACEYRRRSFWPSVLEALPSPRRRPPPSPITTQVFTRLALAPEMPAIAESRPMMSAAQAAFALPITPHSFAAAEMKEPVARKELTALLISDVQPAWLEGHSTMD